MLKFQMNNIMLCLALFILNKIKMYNRLYLNSLSNFEMVIQYFSCETLKNIYFNERKLQKKRKKLGTKSDTKKTIFINIICLIG